MRTAPDRASIVAGPKVGSSSPAVHAAAQLVEPAASVERRPPAGRQLSVEKDRQPELVPDALGDRPRRLARVRAPLGFERDQRHDVDDPDTGVGSLMLLEVDGAPGERDPREQPFLERTRRRRGA